MLLHQLIHDWRCATLAQKLAVDALGQLRATSALAWRDLFIAEIDHFLEGVAAPAEKFLDYRNQVLLVRHNYWGGAIVAVDQWYRRTVRALESQSWPDAAYSAGVLSSYFTTVFQPLHTDLCETAPIVHRAFERSLHRGYDQLASLRQEEFGGWPEVELPSGVDWLPRAVRIGAELAHPHYQAVLDHYDLASGILEPWRGLDSELRRRMSDLLGQAVVALARVLDRAIAEADLAPPMVGLTIPTWAEVLSLPQRWLAAWLAERRERSHLDALYAEYQQRGKVVDGLADDERAIRRMVAEEILGIPLAELDAAKTARPGKKHGEKEPAATDASPDLPALPQRRAA